MKKILRKILLLLFLTLFVFSSCINNSSGGSPITDPGEIRLTSDEDKIAVFSEGYPEGFWARHDRGNGAPFNCSFSRENAVVEDGALILTLSGDSSGYVGAEFRNWQRTSYGFYSVSMKAAACPGVISSFFIYFGHPWDEIDIEFLGDDTTKVQFNYYSYGVGGHEYIFDLGFDAAEDFHEYAFDWQEDSITWYVDGVAVYKATANIPKNPGFIMMNIWNVSDSHSSWAGKFDPSRLPVTAEYQWIGYQSAEKAH